LVSNRQVTFRARTQSGSARSFAMVPVMPGVIYALGSRRDAQLGWAGGSAMLFPVLMLVAGLVVALVSVNRMVIRQIYQLKRHMTEFMRTRQVRSLAGGYRLARELAEIDSAWTELAERMRHDEAELENAVHDRDVLLKEVHHRVKNNLQLISSIVNLKIRRATTPEALRMLSEVRARVMSIAAVHQSLYAAQFAGKMRADELLRTVVDLTIEASVSPEHRIDISRDYDPVLLYPDQAVPFLLLAAEAVTNALKYMGRNGDGLAQLRLRLEALDSGEARFSVVNTRGAALNPVEQVRGSGLGRSLLAGFAMQLNGKIERDETDTEYKVLLTFAPAPFDLDERDHTMTDIDEPAVAAQS
jgi:two-component sensor histidine kinase